MTFIILKFIPGIPYGVAIGVCAGVCFLTTLVNIILLKIISVNKNN